jgi:uncharacterized membrane protein (DUF2068 family)
VRQPAVRNSSRKQHSKPRKASSSWVLVLIGLFKLLKAMLLVVVGIGAIKFMHKDLASSVVHWVQLLRVDPDNRFVHGLLLKIFRVMPKQPKELSAGTFFYAGLFATEGIGLLLRKRWAEYFTIFTTGGLIPLEVYELWRHFTTAKMVVAIVNVLRLERGSGGGRGREEQRRRGRAGRPVIPTAATARPALRSSD